MNSPGQFCATKPIFKRSFQPLFQLQIRHPSLDYLRGLLALSVVIFHFQKMGGDAWQPDLLVGKLGVYAVSMFFVLSGLALSLAQEGRPLEIRRFFWKRLARIFPLLWLATAATLLLDANLEIWNLRDALLNFSGLFGFLSPERDIATGAWSLGAELVFYSFFPFFWKILTDGPGWKWAVVLSVLITAGLFFAFFLMKPDLPLNQQTSIYNQPIQHGFFFAAGMSLHFLWKKGPPRPPFFWKMTGGFALLAMVFWPINGLPAELLCGWNRVILSLLSVIICAAFFAQKGSFSGKTHLILSWLGRISYSIYLLHPLVFRATNALFSKMEIDDSQLLVGTAFTATLLVGWAVFEWFEKPAQRWILRRVGK